MTNNAKLPQRKSIRLKNYDYSTPGFYFVTICCQNKQHLFGQVVSGEMILNESGKMIEKWYQKIEQKFPEVKCNEMITMPNHFHCIIELTAHPVGADPRVCPLLPSNDSTENNTDKQPNPTLYRVVQWFKTMSTNEYIRGVKNDGWQPFPGRLWQRNYYEHIIRNEFALERIWNYILNNPAKWGDDCFSR